MNINMAISKKRMISIMSIILIIMALATMPSVAVVDKPNNIDLSINRSENIDTNVGTDLSNGIKGTGKVAHTSEEKNLPLTEPAVVLDNFNRPDGPIGSAWTERAGTFSVSGNAVVGGSLALATYNGVSSNIVEADVQSVGTGLQYIGLVLGYNSLNNNLFLKVQNQDFVTGFEGGACYVGNNANGGSFGLGYFTLDSPFTTAHMKAELVGSTVYMTFSNIDGGSGTQTYTCSGAPSTGGSGIGINSYVASATLDNFAAGTGTSTGNMEFVRGTDNGLWYRVLDGVWGPWIGLGGIISDDPDASTLNSNVYVFARGTDNALWYRIYDGSWGAWTSLGGIINSAPGVSTWGSKLYVFVRGTDNALWYRSFDGTSWTGWTSLGGIIGSGPGAS